VVSPGVDLRLPLVARAMAQGISVWGEVELAYRLTPARFLAVTGTNGKSTTTSLLGAMLETAGFPCVVAGNIGTALCEVVPGLTSSHWVVAEVSSFQLEAIVSFRPAWRSS
jgi:UDP-N-acetylmuramoylalanine--D-glutamate ligase